MSKYSGESGAGKTEAAKRIMQYIASVSGESSSGIQKIKDMVLATNPLLESFGCSKTLRNDNSSRHGKYLEIQFNAQFEPVGANITNYLLEKARVVGQITQERNFHIFYQFTKGATEEYRQTFGIQGPESYVYTSASKCTSVDSIDDVADFNETLKAMSVIGLEKQEQDQIFRLLASILWIGNITFVENDEGNAAIADSSVPQFVAYLLEVDAEKIEKAVTERIMETSRGGRRGSIYHVPLNVNQAMSVRDALAKGIYNNLFDWIVARVNKSLQTLGQVSKSIGILDIYGFEIFENNSFEQICINYVNEKLQQIFIQLTLKAEQEEYVREQIKWAPINYFNNKIVCDLIESRRPPGIFATLNDACATAHADPDAADQTFASRLSMMSSNPHFDLRQNKFLIKHYAGDVMYDVQGMTDKNKDQMLKDLLVLLSHTTNQFLANLFPNVVDTDSKRRPPTASDKIKQSANELVETLSKSQPSYIRTIKPNQNRSPSEYNTKAVLHQVKYLGLQENVRIRRAGFAYRQTFEKFVERFYLLSPKTSYAGDYIWDGTSKAGVVQILKDTSIPTEEYQMGTSKIFIKTPETLFALEHMRDRYWHNMAARIQRAWRRYVKRRVDAAIKMQRAYRNIKGTAKYVELRDDGHRILAARKERRTMSILGSRKFWGDYLSCNDTSGIGSFVKKSIGLSDKVEFSSRGELLHAKFGRSSMRLPRIFILTAKNFYIVSETVLNNQVSYTSEFTIGLSSINYVGLSALQDDWLTLSLRGLPQPDPLINCVFKTELITRLSKLNPGLDVKIGPTIQYQKKPGKFHNVKFQTSSAAPKNGDLYKSGTVSVQQGNPASSKSRKPPRKKGGLDNYVYPMRKKVDSNSYSIPSRPTTKQAPFEQQPLHQQQQVQQPIQRQVQQTPVQTQHVQPSRPSHRPNRNSSTAAVPQSPRRSMPPPPPPPPVAPPGDPTFKAVYAFESTGAGQMSVTAGEIIYIEKKETNGWWLGKRLDGSEQGWVPTSYLEEVQQAAPPAAPPARPKKKSPPAPPTKKRSSANTIPNGNGASARSSGGSNNLAGGLAQALRQRQEEEKGLAGGLAAALKARHGSMRRDNYDDDEW